jgi:hypothetical protein
VGGLTLHWEDKEHWPEGVVGAQLPDLSPLTAVQNLYLWHAHQAETEDLLGMVQPVAATLRSLSLSHLKCISPRAALVLQYTLPQLETVKFGI